MGKKLQITIDDGPEPVTTALQPILDELSKRAVVAAFILLGQEVEASHAGTKLIKNKGHVLANHSWDHLEPSTAAFTDAQIVDQFQRTHDKVDAVASTQMKNWRAPRLEQIPRLSDLLTGTGKRYQLSHCDIHADSKDSQGATTAAAMLAAIRAEIGAAPARDNFRLLFHVKDTTATALPGVLDGLVSDGHTLVNFQQTS